MRFLLSHQLSFILAAFVAGLIGWSFILTRPAGHRSWKIADFLWVVLGGFGAVAAVIAGLYRADNSRIGRQIDVAYASLRAFDRDAARFRLARCEGAAGDLAVLCDKVEFLSASTAKNRELPLFLDVTQAATPLQGLRLFATGPGGGDMAMMADMASDFDAGKVLAFPPVDSATMAALPAVGAADPESAADFQVLAMSYSELIAEVGELKKEWDYLRAHEIFLALQVAALCLVAFAAPFRIGKSLAELR